MQYESEQNNYEKFILAQFPNSRIKTTDYNSLKKHIINNSYDALILDNDAFLVDKNPALDNLVAVREFINKYKIIVTAALPSQQLKNTVRSSGSKFIEKGKWKTLEQTIRQITNYNY